MRKIALVMLVSLAAPSTVQAKTRYFLQPRPIEGQQEKWDSGRHAVEDTQSQSSVAVVQARDELPGDSSGFRVYVENNSDASITFGPENVVVELADRSQIAMQTFDNLKGRVDRDIKRRQLLAGLGGALQAGSANGYTTGNFDYSGQVGTTPITGSGTFSYNDPVAARLEEQAAHAQTEANLAALQSKHASAMKSISGIIQTTTVPVGKIFGGIVAYEVPAAFKRAKTPKTVAILVTVGSVVHRISATVERADD